MRRRSSTRTAPATFFSMALVVSMITAFVSPFFIRNCGAWALRFEKRVPPSWQTLLMRYQSWVQTLSWPMSRLKIPPSLYPLVGRAILLIALLEPWLANRISLKHYSPPPAGNPPSAIRHPQHARMTEAADTKPVEPVGVP